MLQRSSHRLQQFHHSKPVRKAVEPCSQLWSNKTSFPPDPESRENLRRKQNNKNKKKL